MPIARRFLACLLLLGCAAVARAAEAKALVVLRPVINFHSGPRQDADVVSQAMLGARLVELERHKDWVKVKGEDDYAGWTLAAALRPLKGPERYPASAEPGRAVEVEALGANVYLEADVTRHAPLLMAPFGARLERLEGGKDTPRWLEVRLPDRRVAWIQRGDVRTELGPRSLPACLELSKRFLGITYTWGGVSSFGFDCSGFTQTILRCRGVLMPRDAGPQAAWSGLTAVKDRQDLQPGDLLFFGKDDRHITHTGLYLGEGTFIHDTPRDHPGVQLSKLSDPVWSEILVAMRRLK